MKMEMVRKHIYLSQVMLDRIDRLRSKTGATLSETVRRAITEFLEREEQRWAE
jgi:metal-responsive CopG/Arc/MetJ family transcriptional regulator